MNVPSWTATFVLAAAWAVMVLGIPGGSLLLALGLLLWIAPTLPAHQAVVRRWLGDAPPLFPTRHRPAEELPHVPTDHPDRPARRR